MALARTVSPRRDPELPPWARIKEKRVRHVERVVALLDTWADAMRVGAREHARWRRAGWLHDAMKDAPRDVIRALAEPATGPPAVWHGPAAARQAQLAGERDVGVLDAVRYHTVGFAGWDAVGRMLYLADFLEPGRQHHSRLRAEQVARVPEDSDGVLREVARDRIVHGLEKGWPLLPETVAFWNALV
jgi:HD superfamily phosphohydrolase YqeK